MVVEKKRRLETHALKKHKKSATRRTSGAANFLWLSYMATRSTRAA
jgi:hypothetical protein